jgi:hypothetical protein
MGSRSTLGPAVFGTLTWLLLSAALSVGLFFTSDCLSEEKREGTIGLLFLTDLRGYDVVVGKLLATSLRAFLAVLAVFPVLGIAFILGGVTGIQFWRASLAVINAIAASLIDGLFISSVSRSSQSALLGTLVLLGVWIGLGPIADGVLAAASGGTAPVLNLSLSSPGYLLHLASAWRPSPFWQGLLINQAIIWAALACTCVLLPRVWQERVSRQSVVRGSWRYRWRFGSESRRARVRRQWLEESPVCWLVVRERGQAALAWGATALVTAGILAIFASEKAPAWAEVWNLCSGLVVLLFYLGAAVHAVHFGVEARGNGIMELLLVSPVTIPQIVLGQWRGFFRLFGFPLGLCLLVQLAGTFFAQDIEWKRFQATSAAVTASTATSTVAVTSTTTTVNHVTIVFPAGASAPLGSTNVTVATSPMVAVPSRLSTLATSTCGAAIFLANLVALVWFGMWMGLTVKTMNQAALRTLVFVQLIPWFVITFASAMLVSIVLIPLAFKRTTTGPNPMLEWFPLFMAGTALLLCLIKDVAFSVWARRKIYGEFRQRSLGPVEGVAALPPILPRGAPASPPAFSS